MPLVCLMVKCAQGRADTGGGAEGPHSQSLSCERVHKGRNGILLPGWIGTTRRKRTPRVARREKDATVQIEPQLPAYRDNTLGIAVHLQKDKSRIPKPL